MLLLSPLEQFQILTLIPIKIAGFDLSITNALLVNIIALLCFSGTTYLFSSNKNCYNQTSLVHNSVRLNKITIVIKIILRWLLHNGIFFGIDPITLKLVVSTITATLTGMFYYLLKNHKTSEKTSPEEEAVPKETEENSRPIEDSSGESFELFSQFLGITFVGTCTAFFHIFGPVLNKTFKSSILNPCIARILKIAAQGFFMANPCSWDEFRKHYTNSEQYHYKAYKLYFEAAFGSNSSKCLVFPPHQKLFTHSPWTFNNRGPVVGTTNRVTPYLNARNNKIVWIGVDVHSISLESFISRNTKLDPAYTLMGKFKILCWEYKKQKRHIIFQQDTLQRFTNALLYPSMHVRQLNSGGERAFHYAQTVWYITRNHTFEESATKALAFQTGLTYANAEMLRRWACHTNTVSIIIPDPTTAKNDRIGTIAEGRAVIIELDNLNTPRVPSNKVSQKNLTKT